LIAGSISGKPYDRTTCGIHLMGGVWQNHNQKYFCNYKTSQKYCSRNWNTNLCMFT